MKFSNCGQTCGQRRFLTSYRRGGKCCQPNCPKAFRVFRGLRPEPGPHAPKSSAIPTSLHPDIQFLPLYHGERENQSFFCLWSFMWSKPLLYRFRQSVEIPQTQVSQGFAAFRLTLSRIPPRHSQITRAANYATFGHRYFSRPGAFFPTYVRQYTLRSAALALWHHLLLDRGQHDGFILYLSILPVSPPKSSLFASGRYVGKAVRRLWGLRTA